MERFDSVVVLISYHLDKLRTIHRWNELRRTEYEQNYGRRQDRRIYEMRRRVAENRIWGDVWPEEGHERAWPSIYTLFSPLVCIPTSMHRSVNKHKMGLLFLLAALVHTSLAGDLYSPTVYGTAPATYVAQPATYASSLRTSVGYGPLAAARLNALGYSAAVPVAAPVAPAAPVVAPVAVPLAAPVAPVVAPLAAPVAPVFPRYAAPLVSRYATPLVSRYAAVPAVASVPVTKYEAQPGYIQNYVDVAHQKVATSKVQIRRPAVQKSFYDIEERIVVRPVGSAVLEFDQPTSRSQTGPTLFQSAHYYPAAHPVNAIPVGITHLPTAPAGIAPPQTSTEEYLPPSAPEDNNQDTTATPPPAQNFPQQPPNFPQQPPNFPQQPPNFPQQPPSFPATSPEEDNSQFDDSDSITIENPDVRARSQQPSRNQDRMTSSQLSGNQILAGVPRQPTQFRTQQVETTSQQSLPQFPNQLFSQALLSGRRLQPQFRINVPQQQQTQFRINVPQQQQQQDAQQDQQQEQQQQQMQEPQQQTQSRASSQQTEARFLSEAPQLRSNGFPAQQNPQDLLTPQLRSNNLPAQQNSDLSTPQLRSNTFQQTSDTSSDVIISTRSSLTEEENMQNQQRLIDLLTGRNGVAEVRSGVSVESLGEAGQVRTRVLSVTPAPPSANGDERVSTRRVVVSRPIQTLQEVDVVQPFTKLQRVTVQQPALIKTARVGLARVNTLASVPLPAYSPYAYVH
ncbi:negative elongation factor A-like [Nilaparvata lugens]|uniref:negative elongation factor A-like n=1 Tax=Nilaparvata lugens TaxID=108931 RepID=UPI00193D9DE3|nr:negative elongation factor A-like [Nilaparvata lugens]